jgi:hypothetical protein
MFGSGGDRKQVLTRGVIGNTSDFGSEESRFEPWRVNIKGIVSNGMVPFLFLAIRLYCHNIGKQNSDSSC